MSARITRVVVYDETGAERTYEGPIAAELRTVVYWESRRGPLVTPCGEPGMMIPHCFECQAVRLNPQPLARHRVRFSEVTVDLCDDCLASLGAQIAAALTPPEESLGAMLARVTPEQRHVEGGEEYAPCTP